MYCDTGVYVIRAQAKDYYKTSRWSEGETVKVESVGCIDTAGLVLYLTFDEGTGDTAYDYSGHCNHGVIYGAKWVSGVSGYALEFDGVDDYVRIQGTSSLDFYGRDELTVSAWVYRKGEGGGTCCPPIVAQREIKRWTFRYDRRDSYEGEGLELVITTTDGTWIGDNDGTTFPLNEWLFVSAVYDGSCIRIYKNGKLAVEYPASGAFIRTGTQTEIGGTIDGYFDGIIDEVLIYSKALSEEEIKALYNRYK